MCRRQEWCGGEWSGVQGILPVGALHVVPAGDHVLHPACTLSGGRRKKVDILLLLTAFHINEPR